MAKEAKKPSPRRSRVDRRHQDSRQYTNQKLLGATAIIGILFLVVVGVVIVGHVGTFVLPHRQTVVRVGSVEYTRADVVKLVRSKQNSAKVAGESFNASTEIIAVLHLLVENGIISQAAPKFGISVSREEVDKAISNLLPEANLPGGREVAQIERELTETYRSYLNIIQLTEKEHRQQIKQALSRDKFRQLIGERVPTVAEQVRLHRLVIMPEDDVGTVRARYRDGIGDNKDPGKFREQFELLARELSRDSPEMIRKGGDLDWLPKGVYRDYEEEFFKLELGQLSVPIPLASNSGQLVLFMVSDKEKARELNAKTRDILKNRALQNWLNDERDKHKVDIFFDSEIHDWMIKQLGFLVGGAVPSHSSEPKA